jgi:hypothetical protein
LQTDAFKARQQQPIPLFMRAFTENKQKLRSCPLKPNFSSITTKATQVASKSKALLGHLT